MTDARDLFDSSVKIVNRKRTWTMRPNSMRASRAGVTRDFLLREARRLFSEQGYHAVSVRDITEAAKVTRGALAHHFGSKEELFVAVFAQVEREIAEATAHPDRNLLGLDSLEKFRAGVETYLDAASRAETQRITFIDGPAVLGWQRWRTLEEEFYLGIMAKSLSRAVTDGTIVALPVTTLAALVFGSVTEAAVMIAHADDPITRRREVGLVLDRMFGGLRASAY